jgi:hypothetical protein
VGRISAEAKQVHSKCMEKYDESWADRIDVVKRKEDVVAALRHQSDLLMTIYPPKLE